MAQLVAPLVVIHVLGWGKLPTDATYRTSFYILMTATGSQIKYSMLCQKLRKFKQSRISAEEQSPELLSVLWTIKKHRINAAHVFLYLEFLESYELGATGLQVESSARLVSNTVLAWTSQQRHELRRSDLQQTLTTSSIIYPTRNTFYGTRYLSHCSAHFAFNPLFVNWVTSLTPITWCHRSRDYWNHSWSFAIGHPLTPCPYLAPLPRY